MIRKRIINNGRCEKVDLEIDKDIQKKNNKDNYEDFRHEIKVSHLARLFQILTDTYGIKKNMNNLDKIEGQEILAYFPKLGDRYARLVISNRHLHPEIGKSANYSAMITFNLESHNIVPVINDVIRTKATLFGLIKLIFKYLLTGKIKLNGSLKTAIIVLKTIMIGKHDMYKEEINWKPMKPIGDI
ncbi:MAG: hypothetical protein GF364_00185 [Candidatus Lokiarchaeota archaeon]|nr:hypothetical protein [Candidatus Lokiarchaeota archaeon]